MSGFLWLLILGAIVLIYLYQRSMTEGFLTDYNTPYNRIYNNPYNYYNTCQNCGYLGRNGCSNCSNCGWCVTRDGRGQCVPGNANGPMFARDCVYYSQNRPNWPRYPSPYRRRWWNWRNPRNPTILGNTAVVTTAGIEQLVN